MCFIIASAFQGNTICIAKKKEEFFAVRFEKAVVYVCICTKMAYFLSCRTVVLTGVLGETTVGGVSETEGGRT